jgi:hypothetical protein
VVRGGEQYYLVAELDWDDMGSLQRDFASDLGRATATDMANLEALSPGVQSMILELEDVSRSYSTRHVGPETDGGSGARHDP